MTQHRAQPARDFKSHPIVLVATAHAESRCKKNQIYEVGDISDADAIKFAVSRYGKDELRAKELVETITGGRFTLLQDYGKTAKPLDAIRAVLDNKTGDDLHDASVAPTHPLFKALLASKSFDTKKAHELLPKASAQALLRLNILAVHPNGTYTFNKHHVEAYVKKALAEERRAEEAAAKALAEERRAEEAAAKARRWW